MCILNKHPWSFLYNASSSLGPTVTLTYLLCFYCTFDTKAQCKKGHYPLHSFASPSPSLFPMSTDSSYEANYNTTFSRKLSSHSRSYLLLLFRTDDMFPTDCTETRQALSHSQMDCELPGRLNPSVNTLGRAKMPTHFHSESLYTWSYPEVFSWVL